MSAKKRTARGKKAALPSPAQFVSDTVEPVADPSRSPSRSPARSLDVSPPISPTQEPSKKRRARPVNLSEAQEDSLVEWIRENPLLYSKGLKEYKDTGKKTKLWIDKAREMDIEGGATLITWYESMRTRYGKLSM